MLGKIVAFLAVATSVAFAATCGFCYPGYGGYANSAPVLGAEIYNGGFYGSRVLSAGCATPVIASDVYAIPAFRATVGGPEVISSCENSIVSPVVSTGTISPGLYGSGSFLGGCRPRITATAF